VWVFRILFFNMLASVYCFLIFLAGLTIDFVTGVFTRKHWLVYIILRCISLSFF
jgi:hypothetical protein